MSALPDWAGRELGRRTVSYTRRDVILYALAVGAGPERLDLVWERTLRPLPTFGLTLAQWAPDVLGQAGALDPRTSLHAAQTFSARAPLPPEGSVELTARVGEVWDKGSAALVEVQVESTYFTATWVLHVPEGGGFGGDRGPARRPLPDAPAPYTLELSTAPNQAALYRLLGDEHAIHIQPEAARTAGLPRPLLHGLCSLAAVTLPIADLCRRHPADLVELEARFSAPVYPTDVLAVDLWLDHDPHLFRARVDETVCLAGGRIAFA